MDPFGLYIHWPFCQSKCPYCDFNSHVRTSVDTNRWRRALLKELDHLSTQLPPLSLSSIFFGGGTPSLMPPSLIESLIEKAFDLWPSHQGQAVEITLEANPSSVEASKLWDFKKAGVNRLSLGIQSLKPEALKFLGRRHSVDEARAALKVANKIFDRFSFDLIYARPHQTFQEWAIELTQAISFAKGHLSLYQLTIEEGTAFYHAHQRGQFSLPSEEEAADFYELTQEIMEDHGLPSYEVSNHAALGNEAQHNLTYWRYGSFGAIGPGAHGRYADGKGGFYALKRLKAPETWLQAVETQGHGTDTNDLLSCHESFEECLMMGLRIKEGVAKARLWGIDGKRLQRLLDSPLCKQLQVNGFLTETPTHFMASLKGRLCLTTLTALCSQVG